MSLKVKSMEAPCGYEDSQKL